MQNVRFTINDGEKIGVIGRNGVGKSTLFGILAGTDKDFTGDIIYKSGSVVVATQQEYHDVAGLTVLQYVLQGLPEYSQLSHILETYPEKMGDDMKMIDEYSDAMERFNNKGFYQIEDQIEQELDNFQLPAVAHREFSTLSGGQKRLVEVVKIMHSDADLALVDEPTNHMDYIAKQQFVDWMKTAQEGMLVITHDRDVLREVDRIVEMKDGGSQSFKGNYDSYLKQNAVSTGSQMNEFEMIERRIVNLKAKVIEYQRFKEKSRNPSTIQRFKRLEETSRKELAELQTKEKPTFWIDKDSAADLNYKTAAQYDKFKAKNVRINLKNDDSRSKHVLISTRDLSLGYDTPLFDGINIDLREGEAIEFRGRNGAGKTTLIKHILGDDSVTKYAGELTIDKHVRIGVYEQEVSPTYFELPLEGAIEKMYMDRGLEISTGKIRGLMSDYLFNEGDGKTPVQRLSGGQKARFQLIAMLANDPQLLILDEPTNHLDLPSIEEMETALGKYSGAIIYVSHDNYFRDKIAGDVLKIGKE
ncbi:MAG: Uup, transporter ATPase, ATP-binding cassette, subfamily er 3 [Candidatus Saccharibacteria bacterium]|nr:Uup, transporter ATPase, ATP-binding cassette, subfamily er 3 [Candidatus Saccharibacteria bacterium]